MPRSGPSLLGTIASGTDMNERPFSPASPTDHAGSLSATQQLANSHEIRRGNLSKLQCHSGKLVPPDLIPPKLDADELSDSSSMDEKRPCHPQLAPILENTSDERPKKLVQRYSRRWLREERGRRWVEEDYHLIAQCLRELRR